MRKLKTINNRKELIPEEINASNYQITGITHAAQILFDTEINEYRQNIETCPLENRKDFHINGYNNKKYNGLYGEITIIQPILRKGGFCSDIIGKWQRDSLEVEQLIFTSFVSGMSDRDIESCLRELNIKCSRSKACRITQKWFKNIVDNESRDLSDTDYSIISLDATYVSILSADPDSRHYEKKPLLRALGLNSETGYWELLSLRVYEHENAVCYEKFLENLKERGLKNPVMVLRDLHPGLGQAVRKVFPSSFNQGCLFHLCSNVYRKLPRKVEQELKDQIYKLVREEDPKLRKEDLEELVKNYGKKYPKALKSLEDYLETCTAWTILNSEFKTNNQLYVGIA